MFLVFNKQKIYTYMVSVFTVLTLFASAVVFQNNNNVQVVRTVSGTEKLLPIYNVETNEKKIAFTMNCAWNADDIDNILKTLEQNNIKITFFMVGDWIEKYPEAAKKIYEAGHEIASHSDTHPHVNSLSYDENTKELDNCNDKIEEITGARSNIYRAPYGEYNNTVIKAATDNGYYTIQWNLDTLDYTGLSGEEMWNRLKEKLKPGDIILSHNGTKYTAESLNMLINNIKEKGFEIVTVSNLIYKDNYTINSNGTQIKNE
ncbi:MAG: polysaccharide deacetylase family protein [Clostridia bacterium]|nr:polysaccharide deacetylase family protein [Clostridia bacterium]